MLWTMMVVIIETNLSFQYVPGTSFTGIGTFYPHKMHNKVGKITTTLRQIKNMIFIIQLAQVSQLGGSGTELELCVNFIPCFPIPGPDNKPSSRTQQSLSSNTYFYFIFYLKKYIANLCIHMNMNIIWYLKVSNDIHLYF